MAFLQARAGNRCISAFTFAWQMDGGHTFAKVNATLVWQKNIYFLPGKHKK